MPLRLKYKTCEIIISEMRFNERLTFLCRTNPSICEKCYDKGRITLDCFY